jgi:hypothetical protein
MSGLSAAYRFRHYRGDELIWASRIGDLDDAIRKGSLTENEILHEQEFIDNALADGGENAMLDVFYRNGSAPTFYFSLWNDTPVDTDTIATLLNEVTGTGYARISVARNSTDWATLALVSGDYKVTSVAKTFTASGTWTAATQLCLVSSSSGTAGTFYAWVALSATRTLISGDSLQVDMSVSLA